MPSPFPGMDPFLEHPELFPGFHNRLLYNISDLLQSQLPEPYCADLAYRVWQELGATGCREPYVNICRNDSKGDREITSVEVLSLASKMPQSPARELYIERQAEVRDAQINLVEIDLLRSGLRTTNYRSGRVGEQSCGFPYHVHICQFRYSKEEGLLFPIGLTERLPIVPIPLLSGEAPVELDLQLAFDRAYDSGPYRRRISYSTLVPHPALTSHQTEWVAQRLSEAGRLSVART